MLTSRENIFTIKKCVKLKSSLRTCSECFTKMPTRNGKHFAMLANKDGKMCSDRQKCKDGPCECYVIGVFCSMCTGPVRQGYPDDGGLVWGGMWQHREVAVAKRGLVMFAGRAISPSMYKAIHVATMAITRVTRGGRTDDRRS